MMYTFHLYFLKKRISGPSLSLSIVSISICGSTEWKVDFIYLDEERLKKYPLKLAIVIPALFIKQTIELLPPID